MSTIPDSDMRGKFQSPAQRKKRSLLTATLGFPRIATRKHLYQNNAAVCQLQRNTCEIVFLFSLKHTKNVNRFDWKIVDARRWT